MDNTFWQLNKSINAAKTAYIEINLSWNEKKSKRSDLKRQFFFFVYNR